MTVRTANHFAIAGGALSAALIDALVKNGSLSSDEASLVIRDAQNRLGSFIGPGTVGTDAAEASRIIGELLLGLPKAGSQPSAQ